MVKFFSRDPTYAAHFEAVVPYNTVAPEGRPRDRPHWSAVRRWRDGDPVHVLQRAQGARQELAIRPMRDTSKDVWIAPFVIPDG